MSSAVSPIMSTPSLAINKIWRLMFKSRRFFECLTPPALNAGDVEFLNVV